MAGRNTPEEKRISARQRYMPIRLSSLSTGSIMKFGVYIGTDERQAPVLYCGQDVPFPRYVGDRLVERGVSHVFIDRREEPKYRRFVEDNLSAHLANPEIELADKAETVYFTGAGLMQEVLAEPYAVDVAPRCRSFVECVTRLLLEDRSVFATLLRLATPDYHPHTHSVHVFLYSMALAQRMGVTSPADLQDLGEGALLHDLGKSLLSPKVLTWPGKLNARQWREIARHPILGCDLLAGHGVTNERILGVVRHHHEKVRGGGYPEGLIGGGIPEYARICSIADVFDALTTRRPYKSALKSYAALDYMCQDLSQDFDRDFFRAFVEMLGNPDRAAV